MESKVQIFDMLASIDINNFDLIEININEETGEMAEVVEQIGGNDSEAGANESWKLPCLWKVKSKSYSNRHEKNKAYEKLLLFYKQTDPNATIDSVKKKINNLRCTFRKELKKLRKSKRSGEGSDNVYVPTLWYFNLLMFTADQEEPRTSISNDTQSDEETEIECEFQNDPDETESDNNDMEDNSHVSLDDQ
ncbi:hypothetical protein JTB14_030422 [Gonioctena quinquepunctata]|nr:hypothetical protein JTB14_030422 [Gonioctena quinquepunctata]